MAWASPSPEVSRLRVPVKVAPWPARTARTVAPRRPASVSSSTTNIAPPSAGTNPQALSVNGR